MPKGASTAGLSDRRLRQIREAASTLVAALRGCEFRQAAAFLLHQRDAMKSALARLQGMGIYKNTAIRRSALPVLGVDWHEPLTRIHELHLGLALADNRAPRNRSCRRRARARTRDVGVVSVRALRNPDTLAGAG